MPPVNFEQYVEVPSEARTKLAAFFNILLMRLLVFAAAGLGPGKLRLAAARAGSRQLVPVVGLDDLLNQLVTDHVALIEIDELDAGDFF